MLIEDPSAGKSHAGICEGGTGQPVSLHRLEFPPPSAMRALIDDFEGYADDAALRLSHPLAARQWRGFCFR